MNIFYIFDAALSDQENSNKKAVKQSGNGDDTRECFKLESSIKF